MTDHCDKCGVTRPFWMGGPHRCPEIGTSYSLALGVHIRTILDQTELDWLIG